MTTKQMLTDYLIGMAIIMIFMCIPVLAYFLTNDAPCGTHTTYAVTEKCDE